MTDPLRGSAAPVRQTKARPPRRRAYVSQGPSEDFMVPVLRRHIEDRLPSAPQPGSGALDVGCGGQPFRARIEELGYAYTGLDIEQNEEGTVDVVASIEGPLPDGLLARRFDLIVCLEVLEHVADWETAFANMSRLLGPGGRLIVTCPHFYELHEEPNDFWRGTVHALELFGRRAGLRVVETVKGGSAWDLLGTALASTAPVAADRSVRSRALAKVVEWVRRWTIRLLLSGRVQRRVALDGTLYVTNVGVFEKPFDE